MIRETRAKTILNRHKRVDSWFMSSCGMNIYRGCTHNCAYCDGRSEKYRVDMEPGSSPPSKRLQTLSRFKESGISTGMFLLPVIPFLTDSPEMLYDTLKAAKDHGMDFVIFGTMTLKQGRQEEYFMAVINEHYPSLVASYTHIYRDEKYGNCIPDYSDSISTLFAKISKELEIPKRIPSRLWSDLYSENEKISLMLEHLDYCLRLNKQKSPYGYAAYQISRLKEPVSEIKNLKKIKGVGPVTEKLIKEIIRTGKSSYLESVV